MIIIILTHKVQLPCIFKFYVCSVHTLIRVCQMASDPRTFVISNMDVFREYAELPGNSKMTPKDKYCMI